MKGDREERIELLLEMAASPFRGSDGDHPGRNLLHGQ